MDMIAYQLTGASANALRPLTISGTVTVKKVKITQKHGNCLEIISFTVLKANCAYLYFNVLEQFLIKFQMRKMTAEIEI